MKKILLILVVASASGSLIAMHAGPGILENQLHDAIARGNLDEVRQLIQDGAPINNEQPGFKNTTPLMQAVLLIPENRTIVKLLLENGAQVGQQNLNGTTALHYAAAMGRADLLIQLLAHIPLDEQQKIRREITGLTALKYGNPMPPKDVRKLITKKLIKKLVDDHMSRVERLLTLKTKEPWYTPRDHALIHVGATQPGIDRAPRMRASHVLDMTYPGSLEELRTEIEQNIRRILFKPQLKEDKQ